MQLGNGDNISTSGICQGFRLHFRGVEIIEDFIPLTLGSIDMILNIQWLETLGGTFVNWKTRILKFRLGNRTVAIKGDPSLDKTLISLKAMLRTIKHEGQGVRVELRHLVADCVGHQLKDSLEDYPTELAEIMGRFQQLFQLPKELPPNRGHEQAIVLREGAKPVNVRPYRYPQFQKDEIERLIQEMLEARIIRPSVSPNSSPVLLVKKRDGSWRFCVDYRALNRETVPNRFIIPIIEELLDELHGATIFSKLDLKSEYHQIRIMARY